MKVRVLYFATIRRALSLDEEEYDVGDGTPVSALIDLIIARHSQFAEWRAALMISVNEEWANADTVLSDGDVVGMMPPVSGG